MFVYSADVTEIMPASLKTLDMIPDNPGIWMLHCHTNHHIHAGMMAFFEVAQCLADCKTAPPLISSGISVFQRTVLLFLSLPLLLLLLLL